MHSMTIRYRVGDGPERTERLTSDVATLSKALEWAPQQMALRLMRDGMITSGAEMTTLSVAPVVEIPADVRDNSETVTDYAFSRHRSPDRGVVTPDYRDRTIGHADLFGYTLYSWHDVNQGNKQGWGAGQRCRFDMLVNAVGKVVHLFHTEYWTRVGCIDCEYSYAGSYIRVTYKDGSTGPVAPFCDEHGLMYKREAERLGHTWTESDPLLIGQHD